MSFLKLTPPFILINFLILFTCLTIAAIEGSRAFIAGYLLNIIGCYFIYKGIWNVKKIVVAGLLCLIFIAILSLAFKTDSTLGRIFIYKISFEILKDSFPHGVGLFNFPIVYPEYQAAFFENSQFSMKEFLLADNVYYAFNDYFQLIIELGIVGVLIVCAGIFGIPILVYRSLKENCNSLSLIFSSQIVALCIAAFFTHVFERSLFQLLFLMSISYLLFTKSFNKKTTIGGIGFVVSIWLVISYGKDFLYRKQLKDFEYAKILIGTGYIQEGLSICTELYPVLGDNIEFLTFYCNQASFLSELKAIDLINHTLLRRKHNMLYYQLGSAHLRAGNFNDAEKAYLKAIHTVPNRFRTREGLFNLYVNSKQYQKAIVFATKSLQLPVKIESPEVKAIRENLKNNLHLLRKKITL